MIYIKRALWILGYPIVRSLCSILFLIAIVFEYFECLYFYIKNGDVQICTTYLDWCTNILDWYNDIEPEEN